MKSHLSENLAASDYLQARRDPGLRAADHLILSDLLRLVEQVAPRMEGVVFDYGCGGAPYRSLFANASRYIAADILSGPRVDRILPDDGGTHEPSEAYDGLFSSQVLEHVRYPSHYLQECRRLLRTEGTLFLSTHGMFHEHGCPHDYSRWTARGLEDLVAHHGFEVIEAYKLTTNVRALIQTLHFLVERADCPERPVANRIFSIAKHAYSRLAVPILNILANRCKSHGVVPADHDVSTYVGIALVARKRG